LFKAAFTLGQASPDGRRVGLYPRALRLQRDRTANGALFLGGLPLVKAATGEDVSVEELVGAEMHTLRRRRLRLSRCLRGGRHRDRPLMHQINARGTFMVSKLAPPYLFKAENPHILMLSPPLDMKEKWFADHTAYSMAKFGMSFVVLRLAGEFRSKGIAVNALWPRTTIATAAVRNLFGGDALMRASRKPEIHAAPYPTQAEPRPEEHRAGRLQGIHHLPTPSARGGDRTDLRTSPCGWWP
jgi:hypothetical protein